MPPDISADFEKLGPKVPTWKQLEQWCLVAIEYWQHEWKMRCPHYRIAEPEELRKDGNTAAVKFLWHALRKLKPDLRDDLKPWVLARLLFSAKICADAATSGRVPLGNPEQALQILMIGDWKERPPGVWRCAPPPGH